MRSNFSQCLLHLRCCYRPFSRGCLSDLVGLAGLMIDGLEDTQNFVSKTSSGRSSEYDTRYPSGRDKHQSPCSFFLLDTVRFCSASSPKCRKVRRHLGHICLFGTVRELRRSHPQKADQLRGNCCRLLFKFVLRIFYGTVVVENTESIPKTGRPW